MPLVSPVRRCSSTISGLLKLSSATFSMPKTQTSVRSSLPPLPSLPVGEKLAMISRDHKSYADRLGRSNPSLCGYEPAENAHAFNSKVTFIDINGMKLAAGANTPVQMETRNNSEIHWVIPFAGSVTQTVDGQTHHYGVAQGGMLLAATGRQGQSTLGGAIMVTLDPQRVQQTAQAMLGIPVSESIEMRLQQSRVLPWRQGGVAVDAALHHLFHLIDGLCEHPQMLAHLGVDDILYRFAVLQLRPDLFISSSAPKSGRIDPNMRTPHALDVAIAHIEHHLTQRITISDLEEVCQVSARTLQYIFMARFSCSPMAWIRQRRMAMARTRLLAFQPGESITQIALECGFPSPSLFAHAYRETYDELPSETVKMKKAGI